MKETPGVMIAREQSEIPGWLTRQGSRIIRFATRRREVGEVSARGLTKSESREWFKEAFRGDLPR